MQIALISAHASPQAPSGTVDGGGQSAHVAELAAALGRQGHGVRIYTRRAHPDAAAYVTLPGGVTLAHLPAGPAEPAGKHALLPYLGQFQDELARHWREHGPPDVAHAHYWTSGLAALGAGRQHRVPAVLTCHGLGLLHRRHHGDGDPSPAGRIGYERLLGRTVEQLIAQCSDERSELLRMGVPRSRIALIPSGVDGELFHPDGPAVGRSSGRPRVLAVGRLAARKGHADLVRALARVPEAELVVVGGPSAAQLSGDPAAVEFAELAEAYHVADRIRLVGHVPRSELPRWYRSADVLACAAWHEPFGRVALEAMACGVPVVATAVGGHADAVVDGVTGTLTPPRDPRALASAVRSLLRDPLRRLAYASAAADRARQRFAWQRSASELAAVYATAANSPGTDDQDSMSMTVPAW